MNKQELNKLTKELGSMYDSVNKAVETWDEETKKYVLVHLLSLWAVAAKAEERGGKRHPLVQRIKDMLRSYGLKTSAEVLELKKKKLWEPRKDVI